MTAIDPKPELPDDTPIDRVRFPTRIRNVLVALGLKRVGEVRETTDETLLSFQDLGHGSIKHLRTTLGVPSGGRDQATWQTARLILGIAKPSLQALMVTFRGSRMPSGNSC
jgi:DNA-directed RNA polymerase alpha subunit